MDDPIQKLGLQSALPIIAVSIVLFGIVFWSFKSAQEKVGTVVLPGGVTYLGPSPTPGSVAPTTQKNPSEKTPQPNLIDGRIIPIVPNSPWAEMSGKKYPYKFSYPAP